MAGDWLKIRHDLIDDPDVVAIAEQTKLTVDEVVGKLVRLWCWADRQSCDGTAAVTFAWVDDHLGAPGFALAMRNAGWLKSAGSTSIEFPRFDKHMGHSAKRRVLDADRKALERSRPPSDKCPTFVQDGHTRGTPRATKHASKAHQRPTANVPGATRNVPQKLTIDDLVSGHATGVSEKCPRNVTTREEKRREEVRPPLPPLQQGVGGGRYPARTGAAAPPSDAEYEAEHKRQRVAAWAVRWGHTGEEWGEADRRVLAEMRPQVRERFEAMGPERRLTLVAIELDVLAYRNALELMD